MRKTFLLTRQFLSFSLVCCALLHVVGRSSSALPVFAYGDGSDGLLEDPGPKIRKMYSEGKYDECMKYTEPLALGREKRNPLVQSYYARLLKRAGRTDEAIEHFEELLRLAPFGWMEREAKNNLRDLRELKERQAKSGGAGGVAVKSTDTLHNVPSGPGKEGYVGLAIAADGSIIRAFPGSPAQLANLTAGDKIKSIDKVPTAGRSADQIAMLIRGLPGTMVTLVIDRGGKLYSVYVVRGQPVGGEASVIRRSALNGISSSPSSSPSSSSSSSSSSGPRPTLAASDPQITIFRHTQDTDAVRDILVGTMLKLSPGLRSSMASSGLKITLAPTLVEALPELVGEKPRGYLHGGGYTNCAGLFMGRVNTIFVTERVSPGTYTPQLNTHLDHTFYHEFGHAVDHQHYASSGTEFVDAYQRDCGHLTNGVRDHFYYFTQEGAAGPTELFAELFADAVEPSSALSTNDINLTRTFPECFKFVKGLLAVIN